jgi:lysyl-tRNA synthetase class 2
MAPFALSAGEWFRRGRLLMCCSLANTGSILAHRSSGSTFGRVQCFAATSPGEVSPLACASDTYPKVVECFELFITSREYANGFSEQNDAEDQAARFHAQVANKRAGDEEAMSYDDDFVRTLEYGKPPAGGCGIGIDRPMMLTIDSPTIRDVIMFPALWREG